MKALRKYAAFARIAAVQAGRERGELYGRLSFVVVILGVFSALWRAVAEAGMPLGFERSALVWYLAATEWILLSAPAVHVEIESEVRRGDVAYQLARPFSYLAALAAQGVGTIAVRAPIVAAAAFACAFAFTGRVPAAASLALVVPFGLAAMILIVGVYVLVGLSAFWLGDVSPIFWVVQKLLFILGGLMLPLPLYPMWMQRLAGVTPFPTLLAGPAGFMLGPGAGGAWLLARNLGIWSGAIALAAHVLFHRAVKTRQVNGG
jgi:viologen exporter family transport system permease protein